MYSILAFDNRSLDNGVYYSNFDLETDNGMNSYQKLSMRMILQSLVAVDENSKKNRLSNIILPTSFQSVGPVSIDETTTIPFLQETIRSNAEAKKSQVESHTPDFNESNHDFEIDFEESLRMWNKNKRKIGNGQYKYICGKTLDNGTSCKNPRNCRIHKNTT